MTEQEELRRLVDRQHGVVSRTQLRSLGFTGGKVQSWIENGRLLAIYRGVYGVGRSVPDRRGRWMAGVLVCGPGAHVARRSAAELWGFGQSHGVVEVVRGFNREKGNKPIERFTRFPECRLEVHRSRSLPEEELRVRQGLPVTSVARTLLDMAPFTGDARLERMLAEAGRLGLLEADDFDRVLAKGRGWRGLKRLRRVVESSEFGAVTTRSSLEDVFLQLCDRAGLPVPEVNVGLDGYEVDCLWRGAALVAELDGYRFHRGPEQFQADRSRDATLQANGYRVVRFTYRDVSTRGDEVVSKLRALLSLP